MKLRNLLRRRSHAHAAARPFFDADYYLAKNPDVAREKIDPFLHYMKHGWTEGRDPSAQFSTLYYKDKHLVRSGRATNPLAHYAGLRPSRRARTATAPGEDLFAVQSGVIAPFFDPDFYRDTAHLAADTDARLHYLTAGWRKGLEPRRGFSSTSYLAHNPHVRRLGLNPFYHFISTYPLLHGGRSAPITEAAGAAAPRTAPALSPDESRRRAIMAEAFDEAYYLAKQTDVRASGTHALTHFITAGVWENRDPNEFFSVRYYRDRYGDEIAEGINPLYHYLTVGRARGYKQNPFGDRLWPKVAAPAAEAWRTVTPAADIAAADVVLIMPVYKGYDDTLAAVHSVLANEQETAFALLVIDDASPDDRLSAMLADLAGRGLFARLRNGENLGFVRTVNRGLEAAEGKDVVLLNADILVYGNWLDRLRRHAEDARVATITPFSNNATICSYPEFNTDNRLQLEVSPCELDACAVVCNAGSSSSLPTGVGFCLYMRRTAIEAIGPLDAETFGRGYGEENDFCMRAAARGYTNLLAHDVFVFHSGSVSFGAAYSENTRAIFDALLRKHPTYAIKVRHHIQADPARAARKRLDYYRFTRRITQKTALLVSHKWGGGIETHVQQLSERLDEDGFDVVLLRIVEPNLIEVDLPRASRIAFPCEILEPLSLAKERAFCADWLRWLSPRLIHVHSLVSLDWASTRTLTALIAETGSVFYYTLHDYAPVCHRNNLVVPDQTYCGLPDDASCRACIASDRAMEEFVDPTERRRVYGAFLGAARLTFAPSGDVVERIGRKIPLANATVRPHEEKRHAVAWRERPAASGILKVATLGAVGVHKGADVIYGLALDARARLLPIEFTVIGYSFDTVLMQSAGVRETGHYQDDETALRLLIDEGADLLLQPSIWPETYSYTLSLALTAGVPPVVFDLGAPAERLRGRDEGVILDPRLAADPLRLNDTLLALDLDGLWHRRKAYAPLRYRDFTATYYGPDVAG